MRRAAGAEKKGTEPVKRAEMLGGKQGGAEAGRRWLCALRDALPECLQHEEGSNFSEAGTSR